MTYYFADLETTSDTNPYFNVEQGNICYLGYIRDYDDNVNHYFYNLDEWFKLMSKYSVKYLYFHNLSFDGNFILKYLVQNCGFEITTIKPYENKQTINILKTSASNYLYFIMRYKNKDYRYINCEVFCSFKKTQVSVEKIGELIHQRKLEIDHDSINYNTIKENIDAHNYCKRDVDNVVGYFKGLKIENKHFDSYMKMLTSGQTIWKRITNVNKKHKVDMLNITPEMYYKYKPYYYGGYTQYNKMYYNKICENINGAVIDNNSFFPSIMLGKLAWKVIDLDEINKNNYQYNVDYTIGYMVMLNKSSNNTTWNTIRSSAVRYCNNLKEPKIDFYTKDEFDILCKFNKIDYEILRTDYFKIDYIQTLKTVVIDLLSKRQSLKVRIRDNGEIELKPIENGVKVDVCSIYGKNSQRPIFQEDKFSLEELKPKDLIREYDKKGRLYEWEVLFKRNDSSNLGDYKCYCCISTTEPSTAKNILIAMHITSIARTKLLNLIWGDWKNAMKCDTDSLFYYDFNNIKNFADIEFDDYIIGKWKVESKFDAILINRAKGYEYWDGDKRVIKCNGVNQKAMREQKKWVMLRIDNKDVIIKNGRLNAIRTKNGVQLRWIDVKLGGTKDEN